MPLYLAMDAGGTNTTYVLADEAEVLARTTGGSIKRIRVSAEEAEAHLGSALVELERQSGHKLEDVSHTCVGIAGASVPAVADWIREALAKEVGGDLELVLDVEIALDAAFHGKRGILVLAGTGSNCCGRTSHGGFTRAGGWGPMLGDQGSAYWIGRQGLIRRFWALDTDQPTKLHAALREAWGAESDEEMIALAHAVPPPDFAKLARVVAMCAVEGDAVALRVLQRAGQDLAELAHSISLRLRAMDNDPISPQIACAGSVLEHNPEVRAAMEKRLGELDRSLIALPGVVDPVMGALWRARRMGPSVSA